MKTAQRFIASFLTVALFASSALPAFAVGFDNFKLTYNNQNNHDVSSGGHYVAWLVDTFEGNVEVAVADLLRGRYGQATIDNTGSKKELSISTDDVVVWAGGSGTSTDIYGYFANYNISFRLTSDLANNQKPRTAGNYVTWLKDVGGTPHVMVANIFSGMNSGTDLGAGDKPRITQAINGDYIIFYELSNGNINYWNSLTSTTRTAATPGALCSDNTLGEAASGDNKVSYVKTCTLGDQTYYFDAGADLSDAGDDSNTLVSSGLLTSANTPVMSTSNGNTLVGWVEGSLLSTATIQVKGVIGELLGLLGLGDGSLLNDKPSAAGSNIVWQRHNANGTLDILGHDHSGSGTDYTVATGATLDGISALAEAGTNGVGWGGFTKTTAGRKDVYAMVPKITTPVGSNIFISPGNRTYVTFPEVTVAGETTFTTKSLYTSPSVPLTGFQLGTIPTYYDISSTATWSGTAIVCFEYDQGSFNDNESLLQILHNEGGSWVDRTISLDTNDNVVCAGVTSFSEVAFAVRPPTVISSIDHTSISNIAAQQITISGSGFMTGPKLYLGGVQLSNAQYIDANTLTATIPAGIPAGTHDLILINPYGSGATLAQAITVAGSDLPNLEGMVTDAGITAQSEPAVYEAIDKAKKALKKGDKKAAKEKLKELRKELKRIKDKKKSRGFEFNLVSKAYAEERFEIKKPTTNDPEKITGAKKAKLELKNASLKLPKTTITPAPVRKSQKIKTNDQKMDELINYSDGLIAGLDVKPAPLALDMDTFQWGAIMAAAVGSIILVHHHVRRHKRKNK